MCSVNTNLFTALLMMFVFVLTGPAAGRMLLLLCLLPLVSGSTTLTLNATHRAGHDHGEWERLCAPVFTSFVLEMETGSKSGE